MANLALYKFWIVCLLPTVLEWAVFRFYFQTFDSEVIRFASIIQIAEACPGISKGS